MTTRTITIVMRTGNDFDVFEGERFSGRLCWDEMLGQVASMTHPKINEPRYRMLTHDEQSVIEEDRELRRRVCFWRNEAGL